MVSWSVPRWWKFWSAAGIQLNGWAHYAPDGEPSLLEARGPAGRAFHGGTVHDRYVFPFISRHCGRFWPEQVGRPADADGLHATPVDHVADPRACIRCPGPPSRGPHGAVRVHTGFRGLRFCAELRHLADIPGLAG